MFALGDKAVKTYIFEVELEYEEDGRWSAWIEALPGCTAWGYAKEEALTAIRDAAEACVEDVIESGEELPKEEVKIVEAPVVTLTL
jgi:predicted RNase H-like HicB family nuclease